MYENYGRNNLVTRFICSECGSQLSLPYKDVKPINEQSDGITGASKREVYICIDPCSVCKDKYERPLLQMKAALKEINMIKDNK